MKRVVTFGEIMMRLHTPGHQRFLQARSLEVTYGGGEANVAVALSQLGVPSRHVTCFPDNDLGRAASAFFRQHGVDFDRTVYQKDQRLGLYFLEVGAGMRPSRIIYDRYDSAFANMDPAAFDWDDLLADACWFHWTGITPAISDNAAKACLQALETASRLGIPVSADVNYRRNLWQYGKTVQEVMPALVEHCDVMVCTEGDAKDIFGMDTNGFQDMAEQMLARFPNAQSIIATRRDTLSASHNRLTGIGFSHKAGYQETETYDINPIVDRIGGGDSFLAGYIYGRLNLSNELDALSFGTAASALKHLVEGDFAQHSVAEVEQILAGDVSGRLLR